MAMLRKARGWTQNQLSDRANVSTSLLSKVEVGDRALTPEVAAALGRAFGLSMAKVLGRASVAADDEQLLAKLRSAMRDYDMPDASAVPGEQVTAGLQTAGRYRDDVDVAALITLLPGLLRSGVDINAAMKHKTALDWAVRFGQEETVHRLLGRGAIPSAETLATAREYLGHHP
ncbi:helix-turn-helix domain-containing protein [Streptomyces sp. NPDC018352]|uniref:helix-turn-helix domain-containing protein n=1 Tax=Streptomyces sp. NPDC018352 TaxID=3157194 RepID=UPI0033E41BE9